MRLSGPWGMWSIKKPNSNLCNQSLKFEGIVRYQSSSVPLCARPCIGKATRPSTSATVVFLTGFRVVSDLPDSGPKIHTEKDRYVPGETLNANCTSPPSKPPASLSFLLNNQPVSRLTASLVEINSQSSWASTT
jgi:hypothetical protein